MARVRSGCVIGDDEFGDEAVPQREPVVEFGDAAREGARLAGQAYTIDSDGNTIQVTKSTGSVNVNNTVYQYLYTGGLW